MKVLNFRSICKQREMESKDHLNKFKVGSVPTLYYIPDFISDSDQKLLLNQEGLSMKKVLCLKIVMEFLSHVNSRLKQQQISRFSFGSVNEVAASAAIEIT
ncbi:unnamed protein product [Lactuca saligna]|uniref:Uncharacterized protein n=1 Tax=Lactuca saligna TaxID=75948 RepID=A0AA35UNH4_LACSI|nr:unnamed protein product [Lactuca saligna]